MKTDISVQELLDHLSEYSRDDITSYAAVATLLEKLGVSILEEETD
ncbi:MULTISPECIES: hypothetical protein [Alkalihalophilus]|uniref:Uncharacterized protein n=1 Tax=Alkalihalophilus marmarensis DSM 21297 TaxID=1188261 RepID=U6SLT9_9BACI|nr:hypothetical protein [Alkalihalophilus marmarensis]ERN51860.1 hypothetical protein A33I_18790 [Alkalihalophilus marmarensis DSM 21297]MEC2073421.1 hypothetical protein [Alkalihalophilus marmarensis]